jgi:hypothetical protein
MTAAGDIKYNTDNAAAFRAQCLLTGVTATNGQPSAAADGVPVYLPVAQGGADQGSSFPARAALESTIFLKGVGTGGTCTVTARLWGYLAALAVWVPVGATPAGDTLKGTLNAGVAMGETKSDTVLHCEPFLLAGHFDRLYLEVSAIGGTGTTVEAWLVTAHRRSF